MDINRDESHSQGLPPEEAIPPSSMHVNYGPPDVKTPMNDISHPPPVPIVGADRESAGHNGSIGSADGTPLLPAKRPAPDSPIDASSEDDDDEEDEDGVKKSGKKRKKKAGGSGRRRIEIKFIENKSRRQVTFSRRKRGLMKKAYELTTLTGTQALVLIASETGHVYTFATPKLQPVVTLREGKELIQSCLNAPDNTYAPSSSDYMPQSSSPQHVQPAVHHIPKQDPHQHMVSSNPQSGMGSGGGSGVGMVGGPPPSVHHPHHDPHMMYSIPPPHIQGPPHGYSPSPQASAHMRGYGDGMGYVPSVAHSHPGHSLPPMGGSHMGGGSQMNPGGLIPKRDTSGPMGHDLDSRSPYSGHNM